MRRSSLTPLLASALLLGGGAALAAVVAACERAQSYVYSAQVYDPANDCLNAYTPIEVVNGPGVGSKCDPVCLTVGADLYLSTMCPPLPAVATEVPLDDPRCIAAIAALQRDGGSSCDEVVDDDAGTGEEADAEPEAGDDDAEAADAATQDADDDAG